MASSGGGDPIAMMADCRCWGRATKESPTGEGRGILAQAVGRRERVGQCGGAGIASRDGDKADM
jgi:hypothetical protein